ncbi:MAG TPA: hypothetical protein VGG77_03585 [Roseiarcus sp.]
MTDLYPEMYLPADDYVTRQPLDASDGEHFRFAFELVAADCTAVITNTPHNTREACAIVKNLIALVEVQRVDFSRRCSDQSGAPSQGGFTFSTDRPSTAKSFAVGVLG